MLLNFIKQFRLHLDKTLKACIKGKVHTKIKILLSFTQVFLNLNTEEDIFKNMGNQTLVGPR